MDPAQCNYEIYDCEMLAIVEALKDWRPFLEGLPTPFDIITDHANLQFWRTAQDLGCCQARWALYLSHFDFRLQHRPGKANTQADPLSRMPQHHVSDADDNNQRVVLRPEHFAHLAATSMLVNPLEDRICQASAWESMVLEGLEKLRNSGPQRLVNGLTEWAERDGIILYKE